MEDNQFLPETINEEAERREANDALPQDPLPEITDAGVTAGEPVSDIRPDERAVMEEDRQAAEAVAAQEMARAATQQAPFVLEDWEQTVEEVEADVERKSRQRKGLRILVGVLLSLFILLGAAALYVNYKADMLLDEIQVEPFEEPIQTENQEDLKKVPEVDDKKRRSFEIPIMEEPEIRNILLIGCDAREGENRGRSDAMILLSINEKTNKIHLVSLMRAIYVSIPNDPDPEMAGYWNPNSMLNAAHTWGGPRLLLKTIQRNFRVDVQDYVEVDFEGFKKVIDTLGGVNLELTEKEAAHLNAGHSGWQLRSGMQHLNGEEALAYSRIRHIDTDFVRTSRQRRVIEALFNQFKGVPKAQLLDSFQQILPYIKTNMSRADMKGLLMNAPIYSRYQVDQLMLPLETSKAMVYIGKMEMYDIDWDSNLKRLHEFIKE